MLVAAGFPGICRLGRGLGMRERVVVVSVIAAITAVRKVMQLLSCVGEISRFLKNWLGKLM